MGLCASAIEKKKARKAQKATGIEIDNRLERDEREDDTSRDKILLIGPRNSGKSTILKQLKNLYGTEADGSMTPPFSSEDLQTRDPLGNGITEVSFKVDDYEYVVCDVGKISTTYKKDTKKWLHYFHDVTAVFFVAAISE